MFSQMSAAASENVSKHIGCPLFLGCPIFGQMSSGGGGYICNVVNGQVSFIQLIWKVKFIQNRRIIPETQCFCLRPSAKDHGNT